MIMYRLLDGTTFLGPLFHPRMEVASLRLTTGLIVFGTVFDGDGRPLERVELVIDENGHFNYSEGVEG